MAVRQCFNLAIEVLLVSRDPPRTGDALNGSFHLVIEVLLVSSQYKTGRLVCGSKFQSRNRGSFDFKEITRVDPNNTLLGFNLVIEVLLVSSFDVPSSRHQDLTFQSRNRGSFGFKTSIIVVVVNIVFRVSIS